MNLQSLTTVCERLAAGAAANRTAKCRVGSIDRITPPGTLIATGDLHDNPIHFAKLVEVAGMSGTDRVTQWRSDEATDAPSVGLPSSDTSATSSPPHSVTPSLHHLLLHEIIHPDHLINGVDFSYRALVKVADLKARFPEHVHVVLGNHELSQIAGAGIVKDGVRVVEAFNAGVEHMFGGEADVVHEAVRDFVRSMPLALRCVTPKGDILCAHSVPPAAIMQRFDPTVLSRDLTDEDYEPRRGAAYLMVWGRGYDAELLEDLVERWGVNMFILGHEKVENGAMYIPPNALVLNSDHARGVYVPIDLENPPGAEEAVGMAVPLS